jgi:hypothetical protein
LNILCNFFIFLLLLLNFGFLQLFGFNVCLFLQFSFCDNVFVLLRFWCVIFLRFSIFFDFWFWYVILFRFSIFFNFLRGRFLIFFDWWRSTRTTLSDSDFGSFLNLKHIIILLLLFFRNLRINCIK